MHEPSGILIVDKPENMTSAGVVNRIRKLTGFRKAGHTGTLDPFATGVMICTINRATRISRFFLNSSKTYAATMRLGVDTDTQDATGSVVQRRCADAVTEAEIRAVCRQFEGEIQQTPPAYSALKHEGVPLYRYARKGKPVYKPARPVYISYIKINEINLPSVSFEVRCSSGTYIRTLCADMGSVLGCGGHLASLRRTECGGFDISAAVKLSEIERQSEGHVLSDRLISMSDALGDMAAVVADPEMEEKIRFGRMITFDDHPESPVPVAAFVKVITPDNRLLAIVSPCPDQGRYDYCCVFQHA